MSVKKKFTTASKAKAAAKKSTAKSSRAKKSPASKKKVAKPTPKATKKLSTAKKKSAAPKPKIKRATVKKKTASRKSAPRKKATAAAPKRKAAALSLEEPRPLHETPKVRRVVTAPPAVLAEPGVIGLTPPSVPAPAALEPVRELERPIRVPEARTTVAPSSELVMALPVSPARILVTWEVPRERILKGPLALRLHERARGRAGGRGHAIYADLPVDLSFGYRLADVRPGRRYMAELGYMSNAGRFVALARSGEIETPLGKPVKGESRLPARYFQFEPQGAS